jgi:SLT domain-containing protein
VRGQLAGVVNGLASFVSRLFGQRTNLRVNVRGNIGVSGARAAGGPVAADRTYLVGEKGPELFVPSGVSGRIVPNISLDSPGSSSTQTVNVNAHLEGLPMRARTPFEVAQQLRRVSSMGLIVPRPQRAVPSDG